MSSHPQHQRDRVWRNVRTLEPLPEPDEQIFQWRAGEVCYGPTSPRPAVWLSLPETEQQAGRETAS
jgi:hypothetical protein